MRKHKQMVQRKNRTLAYTVQELLESPRLRIAIDNFKNDKSFLRAILIELGAESERVAKYTVIKQYNTFHGLNQFELLPMLREVSDFTTYNIFWALSPTEQQLYLGDIKGNLTEEERTALFEKVKKELMGS